MTANLGLSVAHEEIILDYLKFAKFKRSQCLKDVECSLTDLTESRLQEETFTSDEVKEMLDGLGGVLKADISSDLIHSTHTSALLLRQIFQQADKWHLKLQVDLSELESKELLEEVARFEQLELSSSGTTLHHKHNTLEPLNTIGGDKLLQMEIQRLKDENFRLLQRLYSLEEKATSALTTKDQLQEDLLNQQASNPPAVATSHYEQKISELELQLKQVAESGSLTQQSCNATAMEKELADLSHKLLQTTAELEETKKDLEKKFNETPQYVNMRKMLASKNDTIKELRSQIKRLEGND